MTRERVLAGVGSAILRVLLSTIRLKVDDRAGILSGALASSCLICFWHNRIVGITCAFDRVYAKTGRPGVTVLTSPSRDGEILAQFVAAFGMESVRGSSSRRGSQALLELVRLVRGGRDIAITPDGPRGPRYTLGPGVVHLAGSTGAPVLPVHAKFSGSYRLSTWDGFIIPLPFSTISVTIERPVAVPPDLDDAGFERARLELEEILKNGAD